MGDSPRFHPLVERWFAETLGEPTATQAEGWGHIAAGRDTLVAAPTGSGKTLAAFLWAIDGLVRRGEAGSLDDETSVVYVSPLKALGNDIQRNLREPLEAIRDLAAEQGLELPDIRVLVRSGDTPPSERARMIKRPPHILVTTPESLFIMLTAERSRGFLASANTVIVDEIHAVAGDKRGAHLALSLERLDRLAGRPLQRIGLSATQKPIEEIARLLVGNGRAGADGSPECTIVDAGHRRAWDISVEIPDAPLGPIATHELRAEMYDRIAKLATDHRTTLVFVDTRRLAERVTHALEERLGEENVAPHHGSLSREIRLRAEQGLKDGTIRVVVATASLELGIDIGHVDLVCHVGAPRSIATLLQRIGRSGHFLGGTPKGVIFPLTRDELTQTAAAIRAARAGELDRVIFPREPLDVLAQQIVAIAAAEEIGEDDLYDLVRRAFHYRDLARDDFDEVIEMLAEGVAGRHGRRSAHLHRDRVNELVKGRRGARLAAITSGGAIPDVGDYDVVEEPQGTFVGSVNEDFAIESMAGDIFLLGNTSWRIRRIEAGKVRVENAHGLPPTIPFWIGEAPGRTEELSTAVSDLRDEVATRLEDPTAAAHWLIEETGIPQAGAEQIVEHLAEGLALLGAIPTKDTVIAERFFDESGGMQLIIHAPFGARINRAWGLSLRKKFCVQFDFELQAAATDDAILLSLGEQHSFPLESVAGYLKPPTLRNTLIQAMLPSPMFGNRWRWNATRSLALLRHSGGRRVPVPIQRMRAEDLLSAVFPEQVMCQDNRAGDIIPPDHPLVNETVKDCLHEAMDLDGLAGIVERIGRGEIRFVTVETPAPSVFSHEVLNAGPFAFLDDAPLEERRARAVSLRRVDPGLQDGLGALDPEAVASVREEAMPGVRDADELHDLLLSLGVLPLEGEWSALAEELRAAGRATVAHWGGDHRAWVAAERLPRVRAAIPGLGLENELPSLGDDEPPREEALRDLVHGWMLVAGPVSAGDLAERIGLPQPDVDAALLALEAAGVVLRGRFTGAVDLEWCERRLLSRIHRRTVRRLRAEIEPVDPAALMRFLLRWQHVQTGTQLHGREGLLRVLEQLQGFELPAPAWEAHVLPARVRGSRGSDLEELCLSGTVAWGRIAPPDEEAPRRGRAGRGTPLTFVLREDLHALRPPGPNLDDILPHLSTAAADVAAHLRDRGASFLPDISRATGRLPAEVEEALWELVAHGVVSGDGVAGLRSLLAGSARKPARRLRALPGGRPRHLPAGRWALFHEERPADDDERLEAVATQLLRRYGVVFRELLARERGLPPWRELVRLYRRWEARGIIRGGRFVAGFVGEQFALPEAIEAVRAARRAEPDAEPVLISAADPLNLVGVLLPGDRISPRSGSWIGLRDGAVADTGRLGEVRSRLRAAQGRS